VKDSIAKELLRLLTSNDREGEKEASEITILSESLSLPEVGALEPTIDEIPTKKKKASGSRLRKMMIAHEIFSLPVSLRESNS